jgi:hypothetical protein
MGYPVLLSLTKDTNMSASYAWIITKDCLADEPEAVGLIGPHNATLDANIITDTGSPFQMLDDDDNVYYQGYIAGQA